MIDEIDKLKRLLVEKGLTSPEAIIRADDARGSSGSFLLILLHLGLIDENELSEFLKSEFKFSRFNFDLNLHTAFRKADLNLTFIKKNQAILIETTEGQLLYVCVDPFDKNSIKTLSYIADQKHVVKIVSLSEFDKIISAIWNIEIVSNDNEYQKEFDEERIAEASSEAPTIRLVNRLISLALNEGASDIHFEPLEGELRVRFRVDGTLKTIETLKIEEESAVTARLKILAKLDIGERRLPQDGRFFLEVNGQKIDMRLSTSPNLYGESTVLRVLDRQSLSLNLKDLGFSSEQEQLILEGIQKPQGTILVTGPTGSGKTTTLYTCLKHLNNEYRKILTVEDPVEYMIKGINQVQVQPNIGRTFANSIRSFLRQDPDIIMVGEIRDKETADIAIQASQTGHLVLSTLHTNSAAASITRLLDMGVEPYMISSSINMIIAQRLVRTLCSKCKGSDDLCTECGGYKYKGRTVISEILVITDVIKKLINDKADESNILSAAKRSGFILMHDFADVLVESNMTTLEELKRVLSKDM